MSLSYFKSDKFSFSFLIQTTNYKNFSILRQAIKCLLFFFVFFQTEINAQTFQISSDPAHLFTIERFANEVYYKDFVSPQIYKTELKTLVTTEAEFPTLPVFAN